MVYTVDIAWFKYYKALLFGRISPYWAANIFIYSRILHLEQINRGAYDFKNNVSLGKGDSSSFWGRIRTVEGHSLLQFPNITVGNSFKYINYYSCIKCCLLSARIFYDTLPNIHFGWWLQLIWWVLNGITWHIRNWIDTFSSGWLWSGVDNLTDRQGQNSSKE